MMLFGRNLVTRNVPRTLGPLAALGAQTGAGPDGNVVYDTSGALISQVHHIAQSAGVGAVSGGAAGLAVALVMGGGLLPGLAVGALCGAAGNGALALLGLD